MSRNYCTVCQRPAVACICACVNKQKNKTHIVILQHPTEVKQSKGTVTLLNLSLSSCQVIVGESFEENDELSDVMKRYDNKIALLYPSDKAKLLKIAKADEKQIGQSPIECLILLDGTWKKSYRLYMMNKRLHTMPHVLLPDSIESGYQIRKTAKKGALSTLEACCYTLIMLENEQEKYLKIIEGFEKFNQQQLSFSQSRNLRTNQ